MANDWTGNKQTTFATLGASSHSKHEREKNDYYATDPLVILPLVAFLHENNLLDSPHVWEPACGEGHLSKALEECGLLVRSTDLIDRGYGKGGVDFLLEWMQNDDAIITNPPYKYAQEFIEHALKITKKKRVICMFLKLTFLEGQARRKLFDAAPPYKVLVFSARQKCALNGDFANAGSSAACYAWFIWVNGFNGKTTIEWI